MAATSVEMIEYLRTLTVCGGDRDGELFDALSWERRFMRGVFSRSGDAALSVGRGNGKSALVAGLACAAVDPDGPLHKRRADTICVASSFQQSRIIFEDALAFLRAKHDLDDRSQWRVLDSTAYAMIEHKSSGTRLRCIASDPRRAHGLRPALALLDEPAQWPPSTSEKMVAAIRTGLGKVPGSRLVALGTRPDAEHHWFAALLRDASYAQTHAATEDDDPFRVATWRRANPSLDHLPSLRRQIDDEARAAKRDPAQLASFKALRLNMGTPDTEQSVVVDADTWRRAEAHLDAEDAGPFALGIDLGSSAAMSAAAGYWPKTGRLAALAMFPSMPDLKQRGTADGVGDLYVRMAERQELLVVGGRTVPADALIRETLARWGRPLVVVADRWREAELRDALDAAQCPLAALSFRGMGFKDGGEDVRLFRKALLDGDVRPSESLLLRAAFAEARVVGDTAANFKLAKSTQGGRRAKARDDAAAAAILAVAEGARRRAGLTRPRRPLRATVI